MMGNELLMNIMPQETRVALVENGVLTELHVERSRKLGLVGGIYRGTVSRVLPGMDAAFVDIGLDRTAFLHVNDIAVLDRGEGLSEVDGPEAGGTGDAIASLLHEGQDVLVQVVKDPLGTKGARLTTYITVPSRNLVLMPNQGNIGISTRIEDEGVRGRLRETMEQLRDELAPGFGFIARTAAETATEEDLASDIQFLLRLWSGIREQFAQGQGPALLHAELPLALRVLRDTNSTEIERIRIDSRESWVRLCQFAERYVPRLVERIEHYPGERPIFELFNVEEEIQRALRRRVDLKSGGYLMIDQTEAMTTVDVNTGGFVGHRNLEETIFKTNIEAAQAIARQLRLRNLGGIIIIDFIDMTDAEHRRQVMRTLDKAMERDPAKHMICEVSPLGLVEMTRKRTRESLEHLLCEPCPVCLGRGFVKSPETVCYEVFREILRSARQYDTRELRVLAAQEVIDLMLDEESAGLAELQDFIGVPIRFQVETLYQREQFDVVFL
ncbi:MAG: ribonuclease G [Thioalkalivibrionaceae bacterium]